ncbi:hypothetical protein [Chromobacterium subtsugae]|uniref:hypothetical protein n=1 Tax=Chromobacterium subtsugae TaxID=251747 RepID=UPI000640F7C3|nr:hypothetical protein [Chromobacterium subtsugae]
MEHQQNIRPIRNAAVAAAALLVAAAVERLSQRGLSVIGVDFEAPMPTIRILPDEKCHAMICTGQAAYYALTPDTYFGRYRLGQFRLNGCRVIWAELDA